MSRTGVFITTMAEVERVKVQGEVDIFQTVKAARSERPHMVSTLVSRGEGRGGLWLGWRGRWSISHCKTLFYEIKLHGSLTAALGTQSVCYHVHGYIQCTLIMQCMATTCKIYTYILGI